MNAFQNGLIVGLMVLSLAMGSFVHADTVTDNAKLKHSVVQLEATPLKKSKEYGIGSILLREIARQAFLNAARDELGLQTRDAALRESIDPSVNAPFALAVEIAYDEAVTIVLSRHEGDAMRTLFTDKVEMESKGYPHYGALVRHCDALAKGAFADVLKKEGFGGDHKTPDAPARVGVDVDYQLRRMSFISQFDAVRSLHAAERDGHRTFASLGALIRGYANLGHLTDFHCNVAHKALKARALLYAERLQSMDGSESVARWHQAYAWAMAGRSYEALWAIKHAKGETSEASTKQDDASNDDASTTRLSPRDADAPEWAPIIEAYCYSSVDALMKQAELSELWDDLAIALAFHAVEYLQSSNLPDMIGERAISKLPGCFRVQDAYNECVGVGPGHSASVRPADNLVIELPARLKRIKGLPASALKAAESLDANDLAWQTLGEHLPTVVNELAANGTPAKDVGEPSWAALGRMIEETAYAQVQRRANFFKYWLSVPATDFVEATRPLYKDHPHAAMLKAYGFDDSKDIAKFEKCMKGLSFPNADCSMFRYYSLVNWTLKPVSKKVPEYQQSYYQIWAHHDAIRCDLGRLVRIDKHKAVRARWLIFAAPYDPAAMTRLIRDEPENYTDRFDEWLEKTGDLSAVSLALGHYYMRVAEVENARRSYQRAIMKEPSKEAYRGLSRCYLQENDLDGYVATLTNYLEAGDDFGLDRAAVNREVAQQLLERRSPDRAMPFAEAAASSYSQWGLQCAAACSEALKRFDDANEYYERCADRYPDAVLDWYRFCKRTGKGSLQEAVAASRKYVAEHAESKNAPTLGRIAVFHTLEGDMEKACDAWERAFEFSDDTYYAANLIVMAHLLGRDKVRDAAVEKAYNQKIGAAKPGVQPEYHDMLIQEMRAALQQGRGDALNVDFVESLLNTAGPSDELTLLYSAAVFLKASGKAKQANALFRRVTKNPYVQHWTSTAARQFLEKDGKKAPKARNPIYSMI